jgi:hypothetical protein
LAAGSPDRSAVRDAIVPKKREIRADFDRDSIVIYQAYSPAIADAALRAQEDDTKRKADGTN